MSSQDWLQLHFLNVDHGDCTIIRHPNDHRRNSKGRISIVDINDWKDRKPDEYDELVAGLGDYLTGNDLGRRAFEKQISPEEYAEQYLDDPINYYKDEFGRVKTKIWRFISTHPDMDHLSGLSRLDNQVGFEVLWDTEHEKEMDLTEEWPDEYSKQDWRLYKRIRQGSTDHSNINPTRGQMKNYWEQDNIQILHPSREFVQGLNQDNEEIESPEYNDYSYVLKINHGNQSVILPGDAEQDAWDEMIDRWGIEIFEDVTILKASHHGREDGFHREAVEAMDPEHIILSVGNKPSTDAHQKYKQACSDDTEIWSTRQFGTIKVTCTRRRNKIKLSVPDGIFNLPGSA